MFLQVWVTIIFSNFSKASGSLIIEAKGAKPVPVENRNNLLPFAKTYIKNNRDFSPPKECKFRLSGGQVREKMIKVLEDLYNNKKILDHGMEVGKELANVLSGGDTTIEKTLSEDDLYKLELDSFMNLIQTKKTQERIKHTLATGKPLVN